MNIIPNTKTNMANLNLKIYLSELAATAMDAFRNKDRARELDAERMINGALWMHEHDEDLLDWWDLVELDRSVSAHSTERCKAYWVSLAVYPQ